MNTSSLDEKKKQLLKEIEDLREKQEKKRRTNVNMYYLLVLLGFGLSIGAVVLGFLEVEMGRISAILVMLIAIPAGLENAFKFGEKRDFHRILVSECYNLRIALNFAVDTEEKLQVIVGKFQSLVITSAKSLPRGQGMQAVKRLYEELDSKGTVPVSPNLLANP